MLKNVQNYSRFFNLILFSLLLFLPSICLAMPPGTLLYRTSNDGKMFGYSGDPLLGIEKGIAKHINSGHTAIYIGQEGGIDYIVEALGDGIVKTPAQYFVNNSLGEKFLGAKIPRGLNTIQQAKVIALAKNLAEMNLSYDLDFKKQKGPGDGEWTCVGLTEKIYESANISNPNNLGALEYDPEYYAVDITPDGYDNENVVNSDGDCFSENYEFSKIARRTNMVIPAPELIGYDAGLEYEGDRYIFLPYTQFMQASLDDVAVDINLAASFNDEAVRGSTSSSKVALRWSLINNPLSSLKVIATKVKEVALNLKDKIFNNNETAIVLNNEPLPESKTNSEQADSSGGKTKAKKAATKKTTTKKPAAAKTATAKNNTAKKAAAKNTSVAKKTTTGAKSSQASSKSTSKTASNTKNTAASKTNSAASKIKESSKSAVSAAGVARLVSVNSSTVNSNSTSANNSNTVTIASNQSGNNSSNASGGGSNNNSVVINTATTTQNTSTTSSEEINTGSSTATSTEENNNNDPEIDWPKIAIIKRIYSTGNNDWVELFNPTDHDFDLKEADYRLEKTKASVAPSLLMRIGDLADGIYPGGTLIKAHDTYLIVRDEANNFYKNQADAIATRDEFTWTGNGYTLYLGNGAISSSSDDNIIDAVGFGNEATYFLGNGPATEIIDNYILTKTASTSNNAYDFSLFLSDEPGLIATSTNVSTSTENILDWEAYSAPKPIDSDGIGDLWHFDECYGGDLKWGVGKWGCAFELNYLGSNLKADLSPAYDLDNFSLSFNYKRNTFSRVVIDLSNDYNEKYSLLIDETMVQIDGLPETEWRYYQNNIQDDLWHQATLVVNRAEHYWAFYVDGKIKIKETFNAALPEVDNVDIWTSQGRILLDELTMWHRALSESEILENYNDNAPFSPVEQREAQRAPILKYFWNFDEGHGSTTVDSVSGISFDIPTGTWLASGRLNTAIVTNSTNKLSIDLPKAIKGKDYSMGFWWRNSVSPEDGRVNVSLRKGTQRLFGFVPSCYRNGYWFNSLYDIFHEGMNGLIPCDDLWHYIAMSYDSYRYSLNFYVDGVEKASSSLFWLADGNEPDNLNISSESDYSEIDELGIWEGALSSKQIKALFNNTPEFQ